MRSLFLFIFWSIGTLSMGQSKLQPAIMLPSEKSASEMRAAEILQFYLQKMLRQSVPVLVGWRVPNDRVPIFLGKHRHLVLPPLPPDEESYFVESNAEQAHLVGNGEWGTEWAVYDFLEALGCRKFTPRDSIIPQLTDFQLPAISQRIETPAFEYRELYFPNAFDENWARWHKLKTRRQKKEEWGLFVHTFEKLCPPEEHFSQHPEFFSWNGRQYSVGQICLSNDTVLQIVIQNLRQKIASQPTAKYWSVSQNDNFDYCKCARCAASDAKFGSPAGTMLQFVNAVAAAFPEKIISTLAYQYTRRAPQGIVPAENVRVCLCSIECNRGLPLEADPTSAGFVRDVREWSAITSQLMIWDYVVQFRDYLSPFPNWHTLQPNLQFFQKNGVKMLFTQGSGSSRSEFSDMRAYILAKLMWQPSANMDSILFDFGRSYYQKLQPIVWEYIDSLTTRLLETDQNLQIYGTPLTPAHSWMTEQDVHAYFSIFEKGIEQFGETNSRESDLLSETMLPMVHALLEQFKIREWGYPMSDPSRPNKYRFEYLPAHHNMVNGWAEMCQKFGYETMHEHQLPPEKYADEMRQFFSEGRVWHLAMLPDHPQPGTPQPSIELKFPAEKKYAEGKASTLLDSRRGIGNDFRVNWLGFWGNDLVASIQLPDLLATADTVQMISIQFLQDQAAWVFFPEKVLFEFSEDGQKFQKIREENIDIVPDAQKSVRRVTARFSKPRKVHTIRVTAKNIKNCPTWHPCTGNLAWIFADEIVVD